MEISPAQQTSATNTMKTIELNIGLHSKTHGAQNPVQIINALTGRGFHVLKYRVAQSTCEDGAEPCLAVRALAPDGWEVELDKLARNYGQDCIAFTAFAGPHPYKAFLPQYWVSPDTPSDDYETTKRIISAVPASYQDALYRAAAAQYHARQSGLSQSFEIRP